MSSVTLSGRAGGPRVGIDVTALLPEPTGVDRYILRLLEAIDRLTHDHQVTAFANFEDGRRLREVLSPRIVVRPSALRPRAFRLAFQQGVLPRSARSLRLDVLHSPAFVIPLAARRPRHLLTIHDMTSFSLPETHIPLRRNFLYKQAVLHSIRRADLVHVPSRFAKQSVLDLVPELADDRLVVIPHGIDEHFEPQSIDRVARARARFGLAPSYILHVGTLQPRKNLVGLMDAYALLVRDGLCRADLVLAGPSGWARGSLGAKVSEPSLQGRVHILGYVPDEDLPALYTGAQAVVYPSLEEGFGFPPLEAMACGTPVIATEGSALRENLTGAAELVPPRDAAALAAAMRKLVAGGPDVERLQAAGLTRAASFRWEDTARQTLHRYELLAGTAVRLDVRPQQDVAAARL